MTQTDHELSVHEMSLHEMSLHEMSLHEMSLHEMSLHEISAIIEQVAMNKSSLELKNILQSTQSLQLFTMIKQKLFRKVIKNAK